MKIRIGALIWTVTIFIAVLAVACGSSSDSGFVKTGSGLQIAVILSGTATGETRDINGTPMECFDVDLISPSSGAIIGQGTDCLDLGSIAPFGDGGGFQLTTTTFFKFDEGTIVTLGLTTAQAISDPLPESGPTHLTAEVGTGNNIIAEMGTGKFKGAAGSTRLSGTVNMSAFTGPGSPVTFDCIFVIKVADL